MNYGFIYETTNLINGKKYIGRHKRTQNTEDPDDSWYLGSGKYLKNSIAKYGKENFTREILIECSTEEDLNEKEIYYINLYNCVNNNNYYNQTSSSYRSGIEGYKFSQDSKFKMSIAAKERWVNPESAKELMISRNKPKSTKQIESFNKLLESNRGRVHSEEYCKAISSRMIGELNHRYGTHQSEITKEKIRKAILGKKKPLTHSSNTSKANIGMRFINNGIVTRRVKGIELETLINSGVWKYGLLKKG